MFRWLKQLVCRHEWKERYCTVEGWAELHYWFKCEKCGKDRVT